MGNRRRQFGKADEMHAPLDDRMLDPEHFGDGGLHGAVSPCRLASATGIAEICGRCKRSEEHTSELQSLMRISYAVFCLKKKNNRTKLKNSENNRDNLYKHKKRSDN